MNKRATIQISFSIIFSLIIIIAVIGVAAYAIIYFVNLGKCSQVSLFYEDLQNEIDEAWNSEISRETFSGRLPGGIENVCFYDGESSGSGKEYDVLKDYFRTRANVFLYPPEESCNKVSRKIEHADFSELGWHCFDVRDGELRIGLEKESSDVLVRVKRG